MNTAIESGAGFLYHICILFFQREIADNEDLGIAGLPVEIAAGELYGVAVQIVEHIGNTELGAVFLKNQNILSIIAIEGVLIIRDAIAVAITVLVHNGAGFAGASRSEDKGYIQVPPIVCEVGITEN